MAAKTCINPDDLSFVPSAFLDVDDFSPQWYRLVQTSPAFRRHWLRCMEAQESAEERHDEYEEIDLDFPASLTVPTLDEDPEEIMPQMIAAAAEAATAAKPEDPKPFLLLQEEVLPKASGRNRSIFFHEKPPKIVHAHLKKSATHRINQPR